MNYHSSMYDWGSYEPMMPMNQNPQFVQSLNGMKRFTNMAPVEMNGPFLGRGASEDSHEMTRSLSTNNSLEPAPAIHTADISEGLHEMQRFTRNDRVTMARSIPTHRGPGQLHEMNRFYMNNDRTEMAGPFLAHNTQEDLHQMRHFHTNNDPVEMTGHFSPHIALPLMPPRLDPYQISYPVRMSRSASDSNYSSSYPVSYRVNPHAINNPGEMAKPLVSYDYSFDSSSEEDIVLVDSPPKMTIVSPVVETPENKLRSFIHDRSPGHGQLFEVPSIIEAGGEQRTSSCLADYCARYNFINEEYAKGNGLLIDHGRTTNVTIGSGKKVSTVGTTEALFRFKSEQEKAYKLIFHVLPSCIHDIILGKSFLRATRTFSSLQNFARRVKKKFIKGISRRLLYLGHSAPTFAGLINGRAGDALADSGSSVLVMDEDYARSLGLPISKEENVRLVFADGSTTYTSGITRGVKWQFGGDREADEHFLDFHILKNAPAPVILSDTFLFDTEAYSKYECYLTDVDEDGLSIGEEAQDEESYFFTINYDPNYTSDGNLATSTLANMEYAEASRRSQQEDVIASLPQADREAAWAKENIHRERWTEAMNLLKQTKLLGQHSSDNLVTAAQTGSPNTIGGSSHPLAAAATPSGSSDLASTALPVPPNPYKRFKLRLKLRRRKNQ